MAKRTWKTELGKQIKAARDRRGISQEKLAERIGITRESINLYEKGKGNPGFKVVAEIAVALRADFNVLGCRIVAAELLEPRRPETEEQLELKFDHDHSFLANITVRPTKKSITITAHSDYGVKTA
jgi:putative transcriptional regulator